MIITYTEGCTPDPESVQEGKRIYKETIAKLVLEELKKRNDIKYNNEIFKETVG